MKKILLVLGLLFFGGQSLFAQVSSVPFSQALDTFQLISGTIVDIPFEDDVYHANLPIGFNFTYNGHTTDKFGVCTNGFITFDSLQHNGLWLLTSASKNSACGLMHDLRNTNTGGSLEYITVGTAPDRMLVVQWKDYGVFGMNYCHLNFQIRLYEGSNCISYYYGENTVSNSMSPFYAGLVGDTALDFHLRTSPNDWTNTMASPTLPGSGLILNATNAPPNGLVYNFGTCPATGVSFSYLTGTIYNDANGNGVRDAGENGIANIIVHESTQNYNTLTDTGGHYALFYVDSSLSYSVSCTPFTYWSISSTPTTYTVNPSTQAANNLDFGMYATPNIHDVAITCGAGNVPWPNAHVSFHATYHNKGTSVESDTIFFTKDSHFSFVSATPTPDYNSGNSLYWLYSNLLVGEYRNISMILLSDTLITTGDTLNSSWLAQPFATDADQSDNTYEHHQACMSSFDPNSKSVTPEGNIATTQKLEYTVNFQNTGTAPAQNVFLHDNLDDNLDVSTLEILGFSHPMTYTLNGTGKIIFSFANINLPDSNSNEPASHGYVRYSISPKSNLINGTNIDNTASIVFDYNVPVVTNTTRNTIGEVTTGLFATGSGKNGLALYPNPASEELKILNENKSIQSIALRDLTGRTVMMIVTGDQLVINFSLSSLKNGIYLVDALTKENKHLVSRLVKTGK